MGAEENKLRVCRLVVGINNGSLEVLDEVADAGFVRVAR
jgi:predicted ester cyclase